VLLMYERCSSESGLVGFIIVSHYEERNSAVEGNLADGGKGK